MPISDYPWVATRRETIYDALHAFVGPDGYKLSDRIWRTEAQVRNKIDALLAYHIRSGTSAVDIAHELEEFLKRERAGIRTRKPYGTWGSFDARRLARTEITAAFGRATIAAANANPFTIGIRWSLSPNRTGDWDCNCEYNATADEFGLGPGIWPKDQVPNYVDHPHCMCALSEVTVTTAEAIEDIRRWLYGEESEQDYGGLFDLIGLLFELLTLWGMKQIQ